MFDNVQTMHDLVAKLQFQLRRTPMNIAIESLDMVIGLLILLVPRYFKLLRGRVFDRPGYLGARTIASRSSLYTSL
jgi:hypothetical protein